MTSEAVRGTDRWFHPLGILALQVLQLLTSRQWSDSTTVTIIRIVSFSYVGVWLGLKILRGCQRRRPHWTLQSWLRYIGLAAMPVLLLALMLFMSSIDTSSSTLGAPGSSTRFVAALTMIAMMISGAIGLIRSIDWLETGEPSEQFTRTRWFQRRLSDSI